jgi:serine/threonine-protein kinase RsbT
VTREARVQDIRVRIASDSDIVVARQKGRELANHARFGLTDVALIATAISELARNILLYAQRGEIALALVNQSGKRGIVIVAADDGPGIPDVAQALRDGYSTSGRLGLGLPGVKRVMDEFDLVSRVGHGTIVTAKMWKR